MYVERRVKPDSVKVWDRWYDADKGVTVIRLSWQDSDEGKTKTAKGVAFCSPEDKHKQTKREGTFHALVHALREAPAAVAHEAFLACIRQGLFAWDSPFIPLESEFAAAIRASQKAVFDTFVIPGPILTPPRPGLYGSVNTAVGPIGPHSFTARG